LYLKFVYCKKKDGMVLNKKSWFHKVLHFYVDGFRSMTVGKTLWLIIFIKVFIMFAILKVFFFKGFLSERYDNDKDKSIHVLEELISR